MLLTPTICSQLLNKPSRLLFNSRAGQCIHAVSPQATKARLMESQRTRVHIVTGCRGGNNAYSGRENIGLAEYAREVRSLCRDSSSIDGWLRVSSPRFGEMVQGTGSVCRYSRCDRRSVAARY